jgi:hypothetical protein
MTPRYEWTPASEPPSTERTVLVWIDGDGVDRGGIDTAWYEPEMGWSPWPLQIVTHWRDIAPPNSSAMLTGSDEGKGE